ncbi:hypothetical protein [Photobacterium lutimaris]|uniref:Uncharacterized protein n=1 Tax=Photobacterium lutimaris TaxID=388278 RepID=A0A2T3IZ15_9GAMM|nr:hypothetical protein [Photobacterium lutimaris]PSU33903.1 hypothetical protein C9I99_11065 [Photobacterium lutimaris]TDR76228.1 hypothetical protein DFP78_103224 [Photobacterium lutimaris]
MFNKQFEQTVKASITHIQSLLTINFDNPHLKNHKVVFDDYYKPCFEVHIQNPMNNTDSIELDFEQLSYYLKHPKDLIVYYYKERYVDYIEWLKTGGLVQCSAITTTGIRCKNYINNKTYTLHEHIKWKHKGRTCSKHQSEPES